MVVWLSHIKMNRKQNLELFVYVSSSSPRFGDPYLRTWRRSYDMLCIDMTSELDRCAAELFFVFFVFHLKPELLTQFPASNDKKYLTFSLPYMTEISVVIRQ